MGDGYRVVARSKKVSYYSDDDYAKGKRMTEKQYKKHKKKKKKKLPAQKRYHVKSFNWEQQYGGN